MQRFTVLQGKNFFVLNLHAKFFLPVKCRTSTFNPVLLYYVHCWCYRDHTVWYINDTSVTCICACAHAMYVWSCSINTVACSMNTVPILWLVSWSSSKAYWAAYGDARKCNGHGTLALHVPRPSYLRECLVPGAYEGKERISHIPYNRKYWRSFNLAVWSWEAQIIILADSNLAVLPPTAYRAIHIMRAHVHMRKWKS